MFDHATLQKILGQAEKIESVPAGVNMTVRMVAKEMAGIYYEQERSPRFRRAFPTFKHYMRGQWVQPDGSIKLDKPGWMYFVAAAYQRLAGMLHDKSNVSSHLKWPIYEACIEYQTRAQRSNAKKLHQAGFEGELQ